MDVSTDNDFNAALNSFAEKCSMLKENLQVTSGDVLKDFQLKLNKEAAAFEEAVSAYKSMHNAHLGSCENVKKAVDRINVLKNESDELQTVKNDAEQLHQLLKEQINQGRSLLEQQKKEKEQALGIIEAKRKKVHKDCADLESTADIARKYLGLEIRTLQNNRVQLFFHDVFPDNSNVTLFVVIRLVNKVYEVLQSDPALDNLKQLEMMLNSTNNFSGFVQLVRELLRIKYLENNH